MKAGLSPELRNRLRRADPAARLIVEVAAIVNQDAKVGKDDWEALEVSVALWQYSRRGSVVYRGVHRVRRSGRA